MLFHRLGLGWVGVPQFRQRVGQAQQVLVANSPFARRGLFGLQPTLQSRRRAVQCRLQRVLQGDVTLSITLFFGTKRRAHLDNFNKLSLDALTGIVYEDDSQIVELHLARSYDKARPRIEIDALPLN